MALIPRRNLSPFRNFFGDDFLTNGSGRTTRGTDLAIDVYEQGGNTVAEMNVPGIDPENIDVSIDQNRLTISGSYEDKSEDEDKNYTYRERRYGQFSRTIRLPQSVDENEASASYNNGVLKVTLPNREEAEVTGTKIDVTQE